mgnify:CR=1 FL=1
MSDYLAAQTRTETDSIGSLEIPAAAYWGVHTARAHENFPIARRPISVYPNFIRAFACVKQAAARANLEIGALDEQRATLIDRACEEIKSGMLHDQFVVGVVQGGAGTSTNMNSNEVITNRALRPRSKSPSRSRSRACSLNSTCCRSRLQLRGASSRTSSRSGAPSCRTPCR